MQFMYVGTQICRSRTSPIEYQTLSYCCVRLYVWVCRLRYRWITYWCYRWITSCRGFLENKEAFFSGDPSWILPVLRFQNMLRRFFPGMQCYPPAPGIFLEVSPTGISARLNSTATSCYSATPLYHWHMQHMLDLGKTQRVTSQHNVGSTTAPTVTQ